MAKNNMCMIKNLDYIVIRKSLEDNLITSEMNDLLKDDKLELRNVGIKVIKENTEDVLKIIKRVWADSLFQDCNLEYTKFGEYGLKSSSLSEDCMYLIKKNSNEKEDEYIKKKFGTKINHFILNLLGNVEKDELLKKVMRGSEIKKRNFGYLYEESNISLLNRYLICESIRSENKDKIELGKSIIKDLKASILLSKL